MKTFNFKRTRILIVSLLAISLIVSCSSDSGMDDEPNVNNGSFEYTISGAASKTVTGDDARFGPTGSFGQTFIALTVGPDELDIRIVIDPATTGTFEVNPMVIMDSGGQIVPLPVEERDSWADLGIGSTFTNDRRNFSTDSANGGSVIITKVDAETVEGSFNFSMMELLAGSEFNNPTITVQGTFTARKQ